MESVRAWVESALGTTISELQPLAGGAGARSYWRVPATASSPSAILMHALPEDPELLPPGLRPDADSIPFVRVTEFLAGHGLPVPRILAVDFERRWVLEEDLGDTRLVDLPEDQQAQWRREVIDLVARVHDLPTAALPYDRVFDEAWIAFELGVFLEHGIAPGRREEIRSALRDLGRAIAELPRVPSLRDVQSQNLMIDGRGKLRILDYQDLLLAPAELDLAGFLYDSYVTIAAEERSALSERYCRARGTPFDPASLCLLALQRKCKDYGIFRRLIRVKNDLRYVAAEQSARCVIETMLGELPGSLRHIGEALGEALEGEPI